MRRLPAHIAALAVLGLLLSSGRASAGGWWSYVHPDRSTAAAGQRIRVTAEAWFPSTAAADAAARTRWYVYLLRGLDARVIAKTYETPPPHRWWSLGDARAVRVGRVAAGGDQLGRAKGSFVAPAVPPGNYALMLCDLGCKRPFAGVVPSERFAIVADPVLARVANRVDRLEEQLYGISARVADTRRTALAERARARVGASQVAVLTERFERRLRALEGPRRPSPWMPVGWLALGTVLGALVAGLLLRRRVVTVPALATRPPRSAPSRASRRDADPRAGRRRVFR